MGEDSNVTMIPFENQGIVGWDVIHLTKWSKIVLDNRFSKLLSRALK